MSLLFPVTLIFLSFHFLGLLLTIFKILKFNKFEIYENKN